MEELRDVEYPAEPYCLVTADVVRAYKRERVIKRTVDKIFSSLAASCPNLTVVVLKMGDRTVERYEDDGTHPFLRSN